MISLQKLDKQEIVDSIANIISFIRNEDPLTGIELGLNILTDSSNYSSTALGRIYDEIGVSYRKTGHYTEALKFHMIALKEFETKNDSMMTAFALSNIGMIYNFLGDYERALKYLFHSLAIKEKLTDEFQVSYTLHYIGKVYQENNQLDEAEKYLLQARDIKIKLNDKWKLSFIDNSLGNIYIEKGEYDKAMTFIDRALKYSLSNNDLQGQITNYISLASLYYKKGNSSEAITYADLAEKYALQKHDTHTLLMKLYEIRINIEKTRKHYKSALIYFERYNELKENIYLARNKNYVKNAEAIYNFDKITRENELLKQTNLINQLEIKQEKNTRYFLISLFFVAVVAIYALGRRNKVINKYNSILSKNKKELLKLNNKLSVINETKDRFFSIVAHDLKNPFHYLINSSQLLNEEYDSLNHEEKMILIKDIEKVSRESYNLLIDLLNWASLQEGKLKVNKEYFYINDIIERNIHLLESIAQEKSIKLIFNPEERILVYSDREMIRTVYRNLLNNAIKYSNPDTEIVTKISTSNDKLILSITDHGIGIDEKLKEDLINNRLKSSRPGTKNEKGSGLGLSLCNELIKENDGDITFESQVGVGTTFYITLPKAKSDSFIDI